MKYIVLIIGLLVMGCGKQEHTDTNESTPTTNTNEVDGTTAKPVKELTLEEKVVGEYEAKLYGNTYKQVFLENGVYEWHQNGKKVEIEYTWSIVDGEIHLKYDAVAWQKITVQRINPDKSITMIAEILQMQDSRKREEKPKEDQVTYKKIK